MDPRLLRPGDHLKFLLERDTNVLKKLVYGRGPEEILTVIRTPLGLVASKSTTAYVTRNAVAYGTVMKSLYEAGLNADIDAGLILELADIFAWDIDFATDIRSGDTFKLVYEEYYKEGKWIRNGRILAAEFINNGSTHQAFYFEDSEGREDYYNHKGRCLRKQFLKSPLRYKRISSYFSPRRLHPILKIYRPHLGVDYAAPTGTPVESIGDGTVEFAGWKGDYGRFVRIRHNHNYITTYGHLSRYARGLRRGQRVKQGEVIGYVGSTGLATGPHLDFRVIRRGEFINPLHIESPPANPVKRADLEVFYSAVSRLTAELEVTTKRASAGIDANSHRERKGG
jgi:murein DD-endopeptidase MepM/ murein hydrolase activator NlpD